MTQSALPSLATPPVLYLTRTQGDALSHALSWPEDATEVELIRLLATVIPGSSPRSQEEHEDMSRFVLRLGGSHDAPCVGISHHCRYLRCSHNGSALPCGQIAWLEDGDMFEVGLHRLEVKQGRPFAGATAPSAAAAVAAAGGTIDLTELSPPAVAMSFFDEVPAPGSLRDLLTPTPSEPAESVTCTVPDAGLKDPLTRWHQLYLRHIQRPHDAGHALTWDAHIGHPDIAQEVHPLDSLQDQAGTGSSLHDLLGQRDDIDWVLAALGRHDARETLLAEPAASVLHLFAPEHPRLRTAPEDLPLLSRSEHHSVAVDSAVRPQDMLVLPEAALNAKPTNE